MAGSTRNLSVTMTVAQLEKALRLAKAAVCEQTGRGRSFNNAVVTIHLQEHQIGICKFDFLGIRRSTGSMLYTNTMHSSNPSSIDEMIRQLNGWKD